MQLMHMPRPDFYCSMCRACSSLSQARLRRCSQGAEWWVCGPQPHASYSWQLSLTAQALACSSWIFPSTKCKPAITCTSTLTSASGTGLQGAGLQPELSLACAGSYGELCTQRRCSPLSKILRLAVLGRLCLGRTHELWRAEACQQHSAFSILELLEAEHEPKAA